MLEGGHHVQQRLHQVVAVVGIGNCLQAHDMVKKRVLVQANRRTDKDFPVVPLAEQALPAWTFGTGRNGDA